MDSSANFTNPTNMTDPTDTRGTGDQGQVWNPTGGPNGTGAWEAPPPPTPMRHNQDLNNRTAGAVWGGHGEDTVNGIPVRGTSGEELDVNRYRALARGNVAAPQLDQTAIGESRTLSMGALGLLGARANGAETPADVQAREQTTGAVNAVQSGAASIRGGAGARAAAARGANATGAQVLAQGNQDAAALHARGVADAAGQYFGAASGQRGQDIGVASTNANLAENQHGENLQNDLYYEGLGLDTRKAQAQANLHMSLADQAAANAGRIANQQQANQNWENTKTGVGTGAAVVAGGVSAYGNATGGGQPSSGTSDGSDDPWKDYSGSDPRMKTGIRPVSNKEAARLGHEADELLIGQRANRENLRPSVGEAPYDGKYLGSPFAEAKAPSLLEVIGARVAKDNAAPEESRYGQFTPEEGGARRPGYAASRAGQPGAMFGGPVQVAYHGFEPAKHSPELARDIAMSDPAAKQEAYDLGVTRGLAAGATPEGRERYGANLMTGPRGKVSAPGGKAAGSSMERKERTPLPPETPAYLVPSEKAAAGFDAAVDSAPAGVAAGAVANEVPAAAAAMFGRPKGREPIAFTRGDVTPSDPKTKQGIHDSPMADANRSMAPSVYEYKAEFLPPEQQPGEKNVGPMANKMEANPIAATAIVKDPQTGLLAIDKTKGLKLVMGGLADLQRQVDQMKGARR